MGAHRDILQQQIKDERCIIVSLHNGCVFRLLMELALDSHLVAELRALPSAIYDFPLISCQRK
jgi:hypothetical protein